MNNRRFTNFIAALALSTIFVAGCNRDQVTKQPDGTQTVVKADGTQIVTHPDGSQTITKPDGTQTVVSPAGGVSTQAANGAQTSVQPNGAVTTTAANGAQVTTQPNGAVTTTAPNGAVTTTAPDGSVNTNPYANGGVATAQPANTTGNAAVAPLMVPAGTALNIRVNQHISVKGSRPGDQFTGTVVNPVMVSGNVAIPDGSRVTGVVANAHRRGHFKGASVLQLRLTRLDLQNGGHYALDSSRVTRTKKGKGKRSFGIIGGGTGMGMLVGGLATGGVGLVVGGLAGAGGGTAVAGLTGNRDIDYPAESVITFRLADAIDIH
jgi:hypothetical protein